MTSTIINMLLSTMPAQNYTATMLGSSVVPPTDSSANGQIDMR
jgi:hypothetical protein